MNKDEYFFRSPRTWLFVAIGYLSSFAWNRVFSHFGIPKEYGQAITIPAGFLFSITYLLIVEPWFQRYKNTRVNLIIFFSCAIGFSTVLTVACISHLVPPPVGVSEKLLHMFGLIIATLFTVECLIGGENGA